METILEVITENYIWFIVGGVVILFAIIGLISEKARKNKGETKEEKFEGIKENTSMPILDETVISDEKKADAENLFGSENNNLYGSQPEQMTENMFEQAKVESAAESVQSNGYEPQSLETPSEEKTPSEDLFAPFGETSVVETPIVEETPVVETPVVEEMPVVETSVVETPVVEEMPVVETPVVEEDETENRF